METEIHIHSHNLSIPFNPEHWKHLVQQMIDEESLPASEINIIFVDDPYLRDLHDRFLGDNTVTDVMTFNLGTEHHIEGEIYISVDRAKDQAREFGVSLQEELARLIIHGLLHLKGYDDATPEEQRLMREKENHYLEKFNLKGILPSG
ncbi:MAG: rRNA maturation RNase YbeY [Calditrichaeota bacterium]|nr:MAG: rRNA maturation RNase YbeY [Calditrichota bacterium]